MVCIPTICPIHRVSMEDHCWTCLSGEFPIVVKTSRGFRLQAFEQPIYSTRQSRAEMRLWITRRT